MKKFFTIFLFFLLNIFLVCYANQKSNISNFDEVYNDMSTFYSNMYYCNQYTYTNPVNDINKVIGKENNVCHVKFTYFNPHIEQDCFFPIDIAKKYASARISDYKRVMNSLQKNKTANLKAGSIDIQQTYTWDKQYCKISH